MKRILKQHNYLIGSSVFECTAQIFYLKMIVFVAKLAQCQAQLTVGHIEFLLPTKNISSSVCSITKQSTEQN